MDESVAQYRRLDSQKIIETVKTLQARIEKRFPGSGLSNVIAELHRVAAENVGRIEWIQRPHFPLRLAAGVLSLAIISIMVLMVVHLRQFRFDEYTNFIQALEASISSV